MKNVETSTGALIAMLIGFITGLLALMNQENVNGIADISENAWWILGGGAAISFLKDYQAISTRKMVSKLTGRTPYEPTK